MPGTDRLHALDAVRAFALILGVVFHAGFSFIPGMIPGLWAIADSSPSTTLSVLLFTSHIFRMSLFFFVAGFFARMLFHRRGARGFWVDRSRRILVPLVGGWLILAPALFAVWMWGLTKTFGGSLPGSTAGLPPPPAAFPLTHLWFLYYLLVLYVVVLSARALLGAFDRRGALRLAVDSCVHRIVHSGTAAIVLPIPLIAALYVRPDWVMWFGIPTPDASLIPQAASLLAYGTAVSFGWLVHRQTDLLVVWGRQWMAHLGVAIAATVACLWMAGMTPAFAPQRPGLEKLTFAAAYGVAIWSWSFACIGLASRFMSGGDERVRYVADASYWIYLVHLPVVAAFQVMVGHLPWHWSVKFPLVLIASLIVLLGSYRYFVRTTFIGQTLNGRKYPRGGVLAVAAEDRVVPAELPANTDRVHEAVATLDGVHKRYGGTLALDGLSLDVRQGEVLAVLGPNGAGKSSAIALWLGLLEPDSGTAAVLGRPPQEVEARRHVGVMLQDVGLPAELRVRELIALAASYYPVPLTTPETLSVTHTEALADRPYGKLSAGQKRQVQFALAVCGRPALLFLDEPTVGLDLAARETMWRVIRGLVEQGCSVVLTTHHLDEAEALADRVAVLAAGRLIATGTVAQVRALVSRREISCRSALAAQEVRAWPEVIAATGDAGRLRITVVDAENVLRRLLAADAGVREVEVRQAGLAEAFTELTKEAA